MNLEQNLPYRQSNNPTELFRMLRSKPAKCKCIVWQTDNDQRFVYYGLSLNLNTKFKTCMITFKSSPDLNLRKPIYIRFDDGVMFKTRAMNCLEECLTLSMPDDFMAYEHRSNPRVKFKVSDTEYAHLNLISDITQSATQEFSFQLIDVSVSGMSINLPDSFLERLTNTKEISLKKIFMVSLANEIECDVVYTNRLKYKHNNEIYQSNRVGLKFKEPIDQYLIDMMKQ